MFPIIYQRRRIRSASCKKPLLLEFQDSPHTKKGNLMRKKCWHISPNTLKLNLIDEFVNRRVKKEASSGMLF